MASRTALVSIIMFLVLSSCNRGDRICYDWYFKECEIPKLWEKGKRKEVAVAVLDSGFDPTYKKYFDNRILDGYDFVENDNDVTSQFNQHGTNVSLLIASKKTNEICGIDDRITIIPIRIINDDGITTEEKIIQGIHYAISVGAKVINLSLGSSKVYPELEKTIHEYQNKAIFVAAAGDIGDNKFLYPAQWSEVIAVQAVNQDREIYKYSCSSAKNAVRAPGVNLKAPVIINDKTHITRLDGSSYACAITSGVIASYLLSTGKNVEEVNITGLYTHIPFLVSDLDWNNN